MDAPAGGAFAGLGEAFTFFEDESAMMAGRGKNNQAPAGFFQGMLKMLKVIANVFFGDLYYTGEIFCRV